MSTRDGWSIDLGEWGGARVRLHATFVLFAAFTVFLSRTTDEAGSHFSDTPLAVASLAILLAGVILHEIAHYWVCRRLGGTYREIVLAPFGSLTAPSGVRTPAGEAQVFLAGPLANLFVTLVCGIALLFLGDMDVSSLWQPLFPMRIGGETDSLVAWLRLTFWVNWLLALFNCIPAFPFDGGRVLRAVLSLAYPEADRLQTSMVVVWFAKTASTILILCAWLTRNTSWPAPIPPWFGLLLLALFLYFSAQQEESQFAEVDESPDKERARHFESDASEPPSSVRQVEDVALWSEPSHTTPRPPAVEQTVADEQRMDEVLARLHERGMESLTDEDRALLARVSERIRSRQRLS